MILMDHCRARRIPSGSGGQPPGRSNGMLPRENVNYDLSEELEKTGPHWFALVTREAIRRGSFTSVPDLIAHTERCVARHNQHPVLLLAPPPLNPSWQRYESTSAFTCGTEHLTYVRRKLVPFLPDCGRRKVGFILGSSPPESPSAHSREVEPRDRRYR